MTENSVFSSAAGAAGPAPAPPAGAADTVTLNLVLKASMRSASSTTVLLPIASRISSLLSVVVAIVRISVTLRGSGGVCAARAAALIAKGLERGNHRIQNVVH